MSTETSTVTDMTCGHHVSSVTEEVRELSGSSDVRVDDASLLWVSRRVRGP